MSEVDLRVQVAGVAFKNPIIGNSGVFGFGRELNEFFPIETLGGISCKGTTLHARQGNPPPRIAETAAGMLNSVGLQNPGVDRVIQAELPFLEAKDIVVIANIAGSSMDEYVAVAEKMNASAGVHMIELNISCPNVRQGGAEFGCAPEPAEKITAAVRRVITKPLIVKLSPNVSRIGEIAAAVEGAGADAVSLINCIMGMRIDIHSRRPVLRNNTGGLSGPAVFPVAVRMVHEVYRRVSIPIIGMGGVASAQDVVEMMLAGAAAVGVGTAALADPLAPERIIDGLRDFAKQEGISRIAELTGQVKLW